MLNSLSMGALSRYFRFPKSLRLIAIALSWSISATQAGEVGTASEVLSSRAADLSKLILWEQTVNDKIENAAEFASIKKVGLPADYRPENQKVFPLWTVEVPEEKV